MESAVGEVAVGEMACGCSKALRLRILQTEEECPVVEESFYDVQWK
jgi:hypothetical protein